MKLLYIIIHYITHSLQSLKAGVLPNCHKEEKKPYFLWISKYIMGIMTLPGYTSYIWIDLNHFKWAKTSDLIFLHPSCLNMNVVCAHIASSRLCLSHLSDTDPRNPEVHGPFIITAQVLDVLRFLLDLRMLETHHTHFINTVHSVGLWAKSRFAKSPLFYMDLSVNRNMHLPAGNKYTVCSWICWFAKLVVTV